MNTYYNFKDFSYPIFDNFLTERHIERSIETTYNNYVHSIKDEQMVGVLLKVKTIDNEWRNLSSYHMVYRKDFLKLTNVFISSWDLRSDYYHNLTIKSLVVKIKNINMDYAPAKSIIHLPKEYKQNIVEFQGYTNLPSNTDVSSWSSNPSSENGLIQHNLNKYSLIIKPGEKENLCKAISNDITLFEFKDIKTKKSNDFDRVINDSIYYYRNGVCVYKKKLIKTKYVTTVTGDAFIKRNFITMDLETREIDVAHKLDPEYNDRQLQVISACIYDGKHTKSFYLLDYASSDDLIKSAFNYIFKRKYNGHKVYFHNFSNFDSIFILKVLANMEYIKLKIIKRDNKIINLKVYYKNNNTKYSISIRDSYLLLPNSLKNLCEDFNVEKKKDIYPFEFVNDKNVKLDYIGKVPAYKYFNSITKDEYNTYLARFKGKWSLKDETIKYCNLDVISLWNIIKVFQRDTIRNFGVDVNKYPTISSLAFAIFRAKYLKDNKIPCVPYSVYKDIKQSYTGGSVDVYIPYGENINRYDINSLYPSVMRDFPSPVGKVYQFTGNCIKYDTENSFGFFKVKVKAPDNLKIPILQTRVKTGNTTSTVAPLGEWEGWYFSEELKNAKKYGYTFEILSGYIFESKVIFKDYVDDLYEKKKNSSKKSSMYIISKLLLNSLYGRFGMNPDKEENIILKKDINIDKFLNTHNVSDIINLGDESLLITYSDIDEEFDKEDINTENLSVPISASITAYARIKMSAVKHEYMNNIYYSDTDSVDLDIKLPNHMVSDNLGDFKYEETFNQAVYIAPKVYVTIISGENAKATIKGLKKFDVDFIKFKQVIKKGGSVQLSQNKFYKNLNDGYIHVKDDSYTLKVTDNKRKIIYNNDIYVSTTPYTLIDGKLS